MGNLDLWQSVEKTDPAHTKRVNQRGGFTSIGAHYQVMRATEAFGPVGIGWGYECGEPIFHGPFIIIPVTLWHGSRDQRFGPVLGCAEIAGNRPDHDAPKKAMTDALTKALSHLGFNADVFLGRFDDNKYVEDMKREFAVKKPDALTPDQAKNRIMASKNIADLGAEWADLYRNHREIADMPEVKAAKDVRKEQLTEKAEA